MRVLVALCVLAGIAHAERIDLPNTKVTLELPEGWTKQPAQGLVAAYKRGGSVLAVVRAPVPNPDAWKAKTRDAYLAEIERGAVAAVEHQKRLSRKLHEVNGVPALDLELAREKSTLVMRVLVFRTYALSVVIAVPGGTNELARAREIVASFTPPKGT